MNKLTKPSPHPYHHVLIDAHTDAVTLCVSNGDGYGGYDHWRVDEAGHERVSGIKGEHYFSDYWMDATSTEVGRNIYNVLDFYVKPVDNVIEMFEEHIDYCSDDIPF